MAAQRAGTPFVEFSIVAEDSVMNRSIRVPGVPFVARLDLAGIAFSVVVAIGGCRSDATQSTTGMKLTSPAFSDGNPIPAKYTGFGDDVSPPLFWSDLPRGTKELALICDDPDALRKDPWVHWVLYKIPRDVQGLPEAVPAEERLHAPPGAVQGTNSFETIGYRGPKPPAGKLHHYVFTLYALDSKMRFEEEGGLTKEVLLKTIAGHVLGKAELVGTYQRK